MKPEISELLQKAERSNEAASKMFCDGYYDFAVSRAYYSMFYAAEALLLAKNLAFSKHSAVVSAFGQHFVKTSEFSEEMHANFRRAFDKRAKGDYSLEKVDKEESAEIINQAKDFVAKIKDYLKEG